ncbi:hypothetical protein [Bacillus sp. FJAT-45350]|uniref:hypothetical protein n=1 Tax=Bacillus sp. FJAT-45350 TaxID=2011014 RepID=UPI000BB91A2B|nr:hypothetical protein [Bacillus sp. FJAT-45350]
MSKMKIVLLAVFSMSCIAVWSIIIWNLVSVNEPATTHPTKELHEIIEFEKPLITDQSELVYREESLQERFRQQGIDWHDGLELAPNRIISVEELLEIIEEPS